MIQIDSFDGTTGMSARLPAGYVYARAWADHLGYGPESGQSGPQWVWLGHGKGVAGAPYIPEVIGSNVSAKIYTTHSTLSVYFPEPEQIHCRMYGEAFSDDDLLGLIAAVRYLPYGSTVGRVIIEQADWLDLNPQFRGLKIAQSKNKKIHVDDVGMEKPTFAGYASE